MSARLTVTAARRAALRGEVAVAIAALRRLAQRGDDSACASLAELLAFQGEWGECIGYAGRLVANPGVVYAGNVFDDMVRLLGRAGQETGRWHEIEAVATAAKAGIERTVDRAHLRNRYLAILDRLQTYARGRGAPPHELINVFGRSDTAAMAGAAAARAYREAVENGFRYRPDLRDKPEALAVHLFGLAMRFGQDDEALRLYDEHRALMSFDHALHVARVLIGRGERERAWATLWSKMSAWWPVDAAQVAPVVLVIDEQLRVLMTRERCEMVLALPRGPEARPEA